MQMIVLTISLVLMACVALAFVRAVRASNAPVDSASDEKSRSVLIWGLAIVGIVVTVMSLRSWPHAIAAEGDVIQINATGGQWYWEIDREEDVPVGSKVVFNLHTEDVNHGFGVVDPSGRLLFQTQAMPGYVNRVEYVFEKPGNYRVLCMEFCGVGHHDMIDEFQVVAKQGETS